MFHQWCAPRFWGNAPNIEGPHTPLLLCRARQKSILRTYTILSNSLVAHIDTYVSSPERIYGTLHWASHATLQYISNYGCSCLDLNWQAVHHTLEKYCSGAYPGTLPNPQADLARIPLVGTCIAAFQNLYVSREAVNRGKGAGQVLTAGAAPPLPGPSGP